MSADEKFQADVQQTKADFAKLEAKRTELKAKVASEIGEAKTKAKAELDAIEKDIDTYDAANQAAMAEYFEKRDAGEIGLN